MNYLRAEGGDRVYGPTATGREYKCMGYHRDPKRARKSCWALSFTEQAESDSFEESEAGNWTDPGGAGWWLGADQPVIGTKGQRIAYFPSEANPRIPAHGYPVTTLRSTRYRMDEAVIGRLLQVGRIDDLIAKKLRNQKI